MTTRKKTPLAAHRALLNDAAVLLECLRERIEKERARTDVHWDHVGDAEDLVRILLNEVANPYLSNMRDPNGLDDDVVKRRVLADARRRMRSIVWTIEPAKARRGVRK
jgi:hypothetical protein